MLFGQLECFLAVARLGNLSRAAEEMFLTQPTLTARLKALEEEIGDELFVRTSRGMRLTEAGKEFLPYAERSVESFEEGRRHLAELRGVSGGRLVLGASPGVGTYALPGLLERFTATYPRVSVSVRTGHSEDILDMTLKEEVQLGLTRAMRHPEVESLPLYEDELVLSWIRRTGSPRKGRRTWRRSGRSSSSSSTTTPATSSRRTLCSGTRASGSSGRWRWTTSRRPRGWSSTAWGSRFCP